MELRHFYAVDEPVRAAPYAEAALAIVGHDPRTQAALLDGIESPANDRHVRIGHLVFDELQLPYLWLADWIETLFHWNYESGVPVAFQVVVAVRGDTWRRAGRLRRPKGGLDAVERDVRYWYRHRVAHPKTSIHALARELRAVEPRATDGRNTIQDAIRRTEGLLAHIGAGGQSLPPTKRSYIKLEVLPRAEIRAAYFGRPK